MPPPGPVAEMSAQPRLVNVAGLSAGAFVVDKPREDDKWIPLINEVPDSIGIDANGDAYGVVIALAAEAAIERVRFTRIAETGAARHAQVQVSVQGPEGPWRTVFDGDLQPVADHRRDSRRVADDIALKRPEPAKWLRVSWRGGEGGVVSMDQFEALAANASGDGAQRDVGGVYRLGHGFDASSYVALRQEGATIRGCFGEADVSGEGASAHVRFREVAGALEGTVESNGYLAFTRSKGQKIWRGVMSVSPDGKRIAMLEFPAGAENRRTMRQSIHGVGWRTSAYQDHCPVLASEPDALGEALEANRRATLYGVNFDVDADTLRPESRPALDGAVKVARAHPDWRLAIEGHTDDTGGAAHNLDLAQRRAATVRRYLVEAGVPAAQLDARGFGASRPLAPNDNPAGRAQNRRVEVARQ
jgi:OmpA-OmpF porin, OOP family